MPQEIYTPLYDLWDAQRGRSSSTGVAMMPTAGPPPQSAVPVVLNGGIDFEWLMFVAARLGAPPEIPAPRTSNPNRVFLGGYQSGAFPLVDCGSYQWYRVMGFYWWGILNPEGLESDFMLGSAPMPGQPFSSNEYLPFSYLKDTILNQNQTQMNGNEQLPELLRQLTQ